MSRNRVLAVAAGVRRRAVLVVGSEVADDDARLGVSLIRAAAGIDALELLSHPAMAEPIVAFVVAQQLPDMSGFALLSRLAVLYPHRARILVETEGDAGIDAALAEELDAVWPGQSPLGLAQRIDAELDTLQRSHALLSALLATRRDLESARRRLRRQRDANAALVDTLGCALAGSASPDLLQRWAPGFLALHALQQQPLTSRRESWSLQALLRAALPRGPAGDALLHAEPSDDPVVHADRARWSWALRELLAGLEALHREVGTHPQPDWRWWTSTAPCALSLSLAPLAAERPPATALLDPLCPLADERVSPLLELPRAAALLRGEDVGLVLQDAPAALVVHLQLAEVV